MLSALLVLLSITGQVDQQPPNIVLIVSDDQGYRDLGCYGGPEILTPHLDRLASQGVRLTDYYVAWPACTPSRGSLLTGRYPQRNGLYDMIRNNETDFGKRMTEEEYAVSPEAIIGMDLREIMISDVLKEAGYVNGVVGKWDGGRAKRFLPLSRGYDFFYGFANTGIDYWTHERYGVPSMFRGYKRIKEEGYATNLFRREAVRFLKENSRRPFFLYVPFNAPHGPSNLERTGMQAPKEDLARYPDHDPKKNRTRYMACVTNMDDAIGEIMQTLEDEGVADNTIVIFFSDNGGSGIADNKPLRGRKAQMFEGGIRVPCIVRWPGQIPQGTVSDEFLTALEWFPTLVQATGAKMPEGVIMDGFDCMPVLKGDKPSSRNEMFWQRRADKAARVGNLKWVDSQRGTGLYDLSKDISEKHDLSESHPELLAKVKARFANWQAEMEAAEPRGPFRDYMPEHAKR